MSLGATAATRPAFGTCVVARTNGAGLIFQASADTDAARGVALLLARTAASSGDTIHVGPGTYNVAAPLLAKNGVNWHFVDSLVQYDGTSKVGFFDDCPTGANGPIVCNVTGTGSFLCTGIQSPQGNGGGNNVPPFASFLQMVNAGSDIRIKCKDYRKTNTGSGLFLIHQVAGYLDVESDTYYDNGSYTGFWWENGQWFVRVNYGVGSIFAYPETARLATLPGNTETVTGSMHVEGNLLDVTFGIGNTSPNDNYKLWVTAHSEITGSRIQIFGGKNYFTVQKQSSDLSLDIHGGKTWYTAEKFSTLDDGNGASGWLHMNPGGGYLNLTVNHFENGSGADGIYFGSDVLNAGIQVDSGTLVLNGGIIDAIPANSFFDGIDMDAIYVGGGTVYINGTTISTVNATKQLVIAGGTVYANCQLDPSKVTQTGGTLHFQSSVGRAVTTNPQDATAGNRPKAFKGELVQYTDNKLYLCTNASTPTFEKITSV